MTDHSPAELRKILDGVTLDNDTSDRTVLDYVKARALVIIADALLLRPPIVQIHADSGANNVQPQRQRVGAELGFAVGDTVYRHPFGTGKVKRLGRDQGEDYAIVEYDSNGSIQNEWIRLLKHSATDALLGPAELTDDDTDADMDVDIPLDAAASAVGFDFGPDDEP